MEIPQLDEMVEKAWNKGTPLYGASSAQYRRDEYGHVIVFAHYENQTKPTGWRIEGMGATARPISIFYPSGATAQAKQ